MKVIQTLVYLITSFSTGCTSVGHESKSDIASSSKVPAAYVVIAKCTFDPADPMIHAGKAYSYFVGDSNVFTRTWGRPELQNEDNGILFVEAGIATHDDKISSPELIDQGGVLDPAWIIIIPGNDNPSNVRWKSGGKSYGFAACDTAGKVCISSNGSHPNATMAYPTCYFQK